MPIFKCTVLHMSVPLNKRIQQRWREYLTVSSDLLAPAYHIKIFKKPSRYYCLLKEFLNIMEIKYSGLD